MTTMASQIFSLTVICSTFYWDVDQREHQSSAPLAFVRGIHRDRWIPTQRASYAENVSFDDVIMNMMMLNSQKSVMGNVWWGIIDSSFR